jgi:hypothetical protein
MTGLNLGLPVAWLVKCKKCGCTINCRAIDPQTEHSQPDKADPPPHDSVIVTCSCCWAAYRYSPAEIFKGAPGPSSNCSSVAASKPRFTSILRPLVNPTTNPPPWWPAELPPAALTSTASNRLPALLP